MVIEVILGYKLSEILNAHASYRPQKNDYPLNPDEI